MKLIDPSCQLFLRFKQEYAYHYHFIICTNKAMCLPHVLTCVERMALFI